MAREKKFYTKYSPKFNLFVIRDMREHGVGYIETMRKYFPQFAIKNFKLIKRWERVYL